MATQNKKGDAPGVVLFGEQPAAVVCKRSQVGAALPHPEGANWPRRRVSKHQSALFDKPKTERSMHQGGRAKKMDKMLSKLPYVHLPPRMGQFELATYGGPPSEARA